MQTILKIPRNLFELAKKDLLRPNRFKGERVGFFSTKCSKAKSQMLVHCVAYNSVEDDHYIRDYSVGVRIGSKAITAAMTRAINDSVGQIHVHLHSGARLPHPSRTDSRELPPLLGSLRNANYREAHGWMILGNQDAWSEILLPGEINAIKELPVSIIGFPTIVNRRIATPYSKEGMLRLSSILTKPRKPNDRYNRQSFLGPHSEEIIAQSIIGVVGLGGGGSHVVQQLAHLGFKNFVLCDDDFITDSNLNRLVGGTLADVEAKRLKVVIAERTIRNLHKDANIIGPAKKWELVSLDLIGCDLIVGCVDKFCIRRDLEAFCRRHMIPYLDVGMDVQKLPNGQYEIYGQVILSMPGEVCMKCTNFLTEEVLSKEAKNYGDAGGRPQVVWSNGLLCSAAVGVVVDLFTDWSKKLRGPVYLAFRGSELSLVPDNRLLHLKMNSCCHFPLNQIGDPVFTLL